MNTLIVITIFLIIYWKFKNQSNKTLSLKYKYKLYDLRDKVREYAVSGKIDKDSWKFDYLDGSISKTVNELESLNLLTAIFVVNKYRNDKNFNDYKIKIIQGIEDDKLTSFFYHEYGILMSEYVIKKHFLIRMSIILHIISKIVSKGILNKLRNRYHRAITNLTIAPETSRAYDVIYSRFNIV